MSQTKHCRSCGHYWTHGIKDGKHDRWCCAVGKPAKDALGECKLKNLKKDRVA
jgi:hypothetical protein